ncbi:MAG TPA: hypothetical protein VF469_27195 [Kofleriaceae bacterium]
MNWEALIEAAVGLLAPAERDTAVLYLLQEVQPQGRALDLGGITLSRPYDVVVFFVDLEPEANWGHRCRYVLMDVAGERRESVAARFPPFLRAIPPGLRVAWKGSAVPAWAVASSRGA